LAEPEPAASIVPPDWQPAPAEAETPAGGVTADVDRLSRLADRLAAARRTREVEIEARFAEQRAQQEAARREVQERMAAWRQVVESEAAPPAPAAPEPAPAAGPPPVAAAPDAAPEAPVRDYAAAVTRYTGQVETGADLDNVERDLRQLAAEPHAPAPVWRLLGDVFVKRDQLQQALEAYRTALARL
jgi:hypothetical protein